VPPSLTGLALRRESFSVLSGSLAGQKRSVMGFEPTPLKKGAEPKIAGSKVQPRLAAVCSLKVCS